MLLLVDLFRRPSVEGGVANVADEWPLLMRANVGPKLVVAGKISAANAAIEAARKYGEGQFLRLDGLEVHLKWNGRRFESRLVILKWHFSSNIFHRESLSK